MAARQSVLKNDFHSFAGQLRIRESSLAQPFHAQEKIVIMFRVVVSHDEMFNACHFRHLHGLIVTAVTPSSMSP